MLVAIASARRMPHESGGVVKRILVACMTLAAVVTGGCANSEDTAAEKSATSSPTTSVAAEPESPRSPASQPTFDHLGVTARIDFVGALAAEADDGTWGCTRRLDMPETPQADQCVVIGFSFDVDESSATDGELVQGNFVDSDGDVQTSDAVDVARPGTMNNATKVAYALATPEGGTLHFSVGRDGDQHEFEFVVTPEVLGQP